MADAMNLLPSFCRNLRTKRYYISDAAPASYLADDTSTTGYWCLKTMGPIGPDDDCAAPGVCGSHRSCYLPGGARETRPA